ncbi:hypothetical protein [Marinobacterium mangrovicola]|uniref:Siderophore ferric iron reductase n=1 Tax=Marinobacterium mangrovicola TaxID=1476959 RepID=A0A4R1GMH8_9GAMM|nr:hypothetical protein [Marinobacterium mangrovicola]TCK08421.1 siderophore ferric iron reductase [Marinobacterium mangrovicola]
MAIDQKSLGSKSPASAATTLDASSLLAQLNTEYQRFLPGLTPLLNKQDPDARWVGSADLDNCISDLLVIAEQQNPEAGPHYWHAYAWSTLSWQPAVLSLLAVHRLHSELPLAGLEQQQRSEGVYGYRIRSLIPPAPPQGSLIERQAGLLQAYLEPIFARLESRAFKRRLGEGLLADRILGCLLQWQQGQDLNITELASQWLSALNLENASRLMSIPLQQDREVLALDRKTCCQYFRCQSAEPCPTCPRIPRQRRINQLRQEWNTDV